MNQSTPTPNYLTPSLIVNEGCSLQEGTPTPDCVPSAIGPPSYLYVRCDLDTHNDVAPVNQTYHSAHFFPSLKQRHVLIIP